MEQGHINLTALDPDRPSRDNGIRMKIEDISLTKDLHPNSISYTTVTGYRVW
jgi:hypothetical protein